MSEFLIQINSSEKLTHAMIMKSFPLLVSAIASILLTNCDTPAGARSFGQAVGGVLGGAAGAVIGHQQGRGIEGGIAGALIGASLASHPSAAEPFKSRQLKFQEAVVRGNVSTARRYYDAQYVNSPINGHPPIYHAVVRGDEAMTKFLLSCGGTRSYRCNGRSLAYHAARAGYRSLAGTLAANGAGSSADVERGSSEYAANEARIRERNRQSADAARRLLGSIFGGGGGSGNSGSNGSGSIRCPRCGGRGYYSLVGSSQSQNECDVCGGSGRASSERARRYQNDPFSQIMRFNQW